jgi:hypothetical protein
MLNLPPREAFRYFRKKIAIVKEVMLHSDVDSTHQSAYYKERVTRANHRAASRYVPSRYPGRILLFVPTEGNLEPDGDPRLVWGTLADKGCRVIRITGHRGNLLNRPHVQVLANKLTEQLHELQSRMASQAVAG